MKKVITIILTGVLALSLTLVQIKLLQDANKKEEKALVVFFSVSVEENTLISDDMLEVKEVPFDLLPQGSYSDINEIVGKYLLRKVYRGEPAFEKIISDVIPEKTQGISVEKKGNVLISIKPNADNVVAWQLEPDKKVDLYINCDRNGADTSSSYILESVKISGIADKDFKLIDFNNYNPTETEPVYIILEVSEKDAQRISTAKSSGSIEIVLSE